jgi:hypothetical protein
MIETKFYILRSGIGFSLLSAKNLLIPATKAIDLADGCKYNSL